MCFFFYHSKNTKTSLQNCIYHPFPFFNTVVCNYFGYCHYEKTINGEISIAKVINLSVFITPMTTNMDMCAKATAVVEKKKITQSIQKKKIRIHSTGCTSDHFLLMVAPQVLLCICCLFNNCWPFVDGHREDKGLSQGPLTPVSVWNSDGVPQSVQYSGMSDTPSGLCLPQ